MKGSYAQLTDYVYPFLAGTQFQIEDYDDGMWSLNDFFRGPTKDGKIVTCSWSECKLIEDHEYNGDVFVDNFSVPEREEEPWWRYVDYP